MRSTRRSSWSSSRPNPSQTIVGACHPRAGPGRRSLQGDETFDRRRATALYARSVDLPSWALRWALYVVVTWVPRIRAVLVDLVNAVIGSKGIRMSAKTTELGNQTLFRLLCQRKHAAAEIQQALKISSNSGRLGICQGLQYLYCFSDCGNSLLSSIEQPQSGAEILGSASKVSGKSSRLGICQWPQYL